jgi:hypothetical protein
VEAESATLLPSAHGETEGFTRRVVLLEGELTCVHLAQDKVEARI